MRDKNIIGNPGVCDGNTYLNNLLLIDLRRMIITKAIITAMQIMPTDPSTSGSSSGASKGFKGGAEVVVEGAEVVVVKELELILLVVSAKKISYYQTFSFKPFFKFTNIKGRP